MDPLKTPNSRQRGILTHVWLWPFAVSVLVSVCYYVIGVIGDDNFGSLLTGLLSLYFPLLGIIVTFHFASSRNDAPSSIANDRSPWPYRLALGSSLIWNCVTVLLLFIAPWFTGGGIEGSLKLAAQFGGAFAAIPAAGLSYFFAKSSTAGAQT